MAFCMPNSVSLRDNATKYFTSGIFHDSSPPRPLINTIAILILVLLSIKIFKIQGAILVSNPSRDLQ
jgi:hypothetical protein